MSRLEVSRIKVAMEGGDADGLLILNKGILMAVLVYLDEAFYGKDQGHWHLEAGFGRCDGSPPTFENISAALRWVAKRLGLEEESVIPAIAGFRDGT